MLRIYTLDFNRMLSLLLWLLLLSEQQSHCRATADGVPATTTTRTLISAAITSSLNTADLRETAPVSMDLIPPQVTYDCDPCLERTDFIIRVVLHGTRNDPFWGPVATAMRQVASDMRVNLDLKGLSTMTFDEDQMVQDILETMEQSDDDDDKANALVVSIPTERIQEAVQKVIASGLPVFGLNSGYNLDIPGLLGHVAMDDFNGGKKAGAEFVKAWGNHTTSTISGESTRKVLYINHAKGNGALDLRLQGASEVLEGIAIIGEEAVDPSDRNLQARLDSLLRFCPYDGILLPGEIVLEQVLSAFYRNRCNFEHQILGTFDTNVKIYDAIAVSKVVFTVSQQPYMQASLSLVMATLYATTGKSLLAKSSEAPKGNYQSGPKVITLSDLPTDSQQVCESEGFPVCQFTGHDNTQGRCDCIDRSRIRIAAVLPDAPFWDPVWKAAHQAATDMGVQLVLDPLENPDDLATANIKTAEKVKSLCQDGVDGLFTTIKSEAVFEAIKFCQDLNVPVVSMNSGQDYAERLGLLQHICMNDYAAGYLAGETMVEAGMKVGYCVNYFVVNSLSLRCDGFRDAINNATTSGAVFVGTVAAPADNVALFRQVIEDNITREDPSWRGVGMLLVSTRFVPAALTIKERHGNVLLGCFDESPAAHDALDNSLLLFGIDQQPYLQGYLPVPMLTWMSHAKQPLLSRLLETGPKLIQESPSADRAICEANRFDVCPQPPNRHQLDKVRPIGLTFAAIIFATAGVFIVWVCWKRKSRIVRVSQPFFLLLICIGTIIMAATIIPLSLDDGVLAENGGCVGCDCPSCDIACMSSPWLFTLGFTIVFASLFSKIWRVNRVMKSSREFRRVAVLPRDVMVPFLILLGLNVICMLVWNLIDPMYWDRTRKCGSDDFTSYGACHIGTGKTSVAMAASVGVITFCAVVLANYEAYKARNVSTDFSESRYIGFAMLSILQVGVVGLPLIFLVRDNPPAQFFVQSGVVTVVCMSVLLLIFLPKIAASRVETRRTTSAGKKEPGARFVYDKNDSSRIGLSQARADPEGDVRRRPIVLSLSSAHISPDESSTPSSPRVLSMSKALDDVSSSPSHVGSCVLNAV